MFSGPRLTIICFTLSVSWNVLRCQREGRGVTVEVQKSDKEGHGHWDLAEINSTSVDLTLTCESPIDPTEWVFDYDDTNITSPKFPCGRKHWNYRWYPTKGYLNQSFLQLRCAQFESDLTLGCRSVSNHSDNVMVKLERNGRTARLKITKQRGEWKEYEKPKSPCVRFTLAQTRNGNYWKCEGGTAGGRQRHGNVRISYCISSQECANLQRKLKLVSACVNVTRATSNDLDTHGWVKMNPDHVRKHPAGVVVCVDLDELPGAAAVEFFFAGRDKSKLHFSLDEIAMNDLIWFDPTPPSNIFYTKDKFETQCKVSDYGLAWSPRLMVKLNGSQSPGAEMEHFNYEVATRTQNVSIGFDGDGFPPGSYEIECSAPVWNTSEWAIQTLKFEVRTIVPPYFDADYEEVLVKEDEANVSLHCDAHGDPLPNVAWSHSNVSGVVAEGLDLALTGLGARWVSGSIISCTAVNKYGQRATKKIQIHATEAIKGSWSTPWAVVTGILGFAAILALGVGLVCLYIQFMKFKSASEQVLSDDELTEFQGGRLSSGSGRLNDGEQIVIECLPYNSEFEVAKENFVVDFSTELGSGAYGVVYKGQIKAEVHANPIDVAVKTVRPNVPIEYFKALMSELKILAYIGHHENIAKLVGAYSANIAERELYVAIELCATSLEKHLRNNADRFTAEDAVEAPYSQSCCGYDRLDQPITTLDLIRWSGEIAAGMEYLTTKRIVHADLAARNILLSFEMHAKICDFGLARQLVNYAYIKKTECGLPWKWMAIESLRQKHFSTMSDVWAFGVTCWEVFSLGQEPYASIEWGWEFVDKLEEGNRLNRPKHASPEIFNSMHQCWYERKERRPQFSELRRFFQEQERQMTNSVTYVDSGELN